MEQIAKSSPQTTRSVSPSSLGSHKTARLAAMLFKQFDRIDGHAPINGFAHVINGQKRHLNGREGLHFNARLTCNLGGGRAHHTGWCRLNLILHFTPCYTCLWRNLEQFGARKFVLCCFLSFTLKEAASTSFFVSIDALMNAIAAPCGRFHWIPHFYCFSKKSLESTNRGIGGHLLLCLGARADRFI